MPIRQCLRMWNWTRDPNTVHDSCQLFLSDVVTLDNLAKGKINKYGSKLELRVQAHLDEFGGFVKKLAREDDNEVAAVTDLPTLTWHSIHKHTITANDQEKIRV